MHKLNFTIDSYTKIGVKDKYKYKINAIYYKSLGEPIDNYLIANANYGFQKGNSYTCNIIKKEGVNVYIKNIKQIDIDISVKNKYVKLLKEILDEDDVIRYLLFNKTEDIKKEIDSSFTKGNEDIKKKLLNAYYSNYLIVKLNNLNVKIDENIIDEILYKYKDDDIKYLFKTKPYYFTYYFNLSSDNTNKLNNNIIKYSKIINKLKNFEKRGHAFGYLKQLAEELSNNDYDISLLTKDIKELKTEGLIIQSKDKLYLKYNYDIEMSLIDNLKKRITIKPEKLSDKDLKKVEEVIRTIEINEKYLLNEEQIEAINNALENNITIITGGAGVGKSTIQNGIIRAIKAINKNNIVKVIAPTGKASNELNKKIKSVKKLRAINNKKTVRIITPIAKPYAKLDKESRTLKTIRATTIHKLFNIKNDYYNDLNKFDKLDYLIIDEASMIDNNLFNQILKNIPITCKVIIVGDINQCEAIGVGTPMVYLLNLKEKFKTITLNENYRQGEGSIINKVANEILEGSIKNIEDKNKEFYLLEPDEKSSNKKTQIALLNRQVKKLIELGYSINDIMILAYSNSTADKINSNIQNIYLKSLRNNGFIVKDKVIQTKNSNNIQKGVDVFNGEQGTISYIEEYDDKLKVEVDFGDKVISYNEDNINQLKLAYGLTIHKCQGAKSKVVILLINEFDLQKINRNIIYTAITRATEKVIIIGNKDTLNKCVDNIPEPKNSSIYEELIKCVEIK